MDHLWAFFVVLFAGVFMSALFRRLHMPWVVTLILGGAIVGSFGFGVVEVTPTIEIMSEIGLVFLMFMAGLEVRLASFLKNSKAIATVSAVHALLPFAAGSVLALLFELSVIEALLVGVVFMSSSIAAIVPGLEEHGVLHTNLGKVIVAATITVDIASLLALSLIIDSQGGGASVPLPIAFALLAAAVIGLRWLLPRLEHFLSDGLWGAHASDEQELRAIIVVCMGTALLFGLFGVHPIVGGFFAGLVLSDTVKSAPVRGKLHAIGYGVFIPMFFVVIGMQTDFSLFFELSPTLALALMLAVGAIASKFFAGWIGGRLAGFSHGESVLIGATGIPRLSTSLAAVFAAREFGVFSDELAAALVALSIVTTVISPLVIGAAGKWSHIFARS